MSDATSVMGGAVFDGALRVADAGLCGMIALRGDLGSQGIAGAVKTATGLSLPAMRAVQFGAGGGVAWMSPDEVLLFCDYAAADDLVARLETDLAGQHALAVNLSDARARFTLTGRGVREVLAKGSPADLSPAALPVGEMRRTRLGQVAAGIWLSDEQTADLICFRSVGGFVWDWLCLAARDSVPDYF